MDAAAMGMRWTLRMRGRDGCGTCRDATDAVDMGTRWMRRTRGHDGCGGRGDAMDAADILDAVDHGRDQGPGDMGQCIVVT